MPIPEIYYGFKNIPFCKKCMAIVDYKDLSTDEFFRWLDQDVDRKIKGKALIRYFDLDQILKESSS